MRNMRFRQSDQTCNVLVGCPSAVTNMIEWFRKKSSVVAVILMAVIVQACIRGRPTTSNTGSRRILNQPTTSTTTAECDPNYSGCVPIASDVDCEGGSGNGPAYVKGPVKVLGTDLYGLDKDGDGIGCE